MLRKKRISVFEKGKDGEESHPCYDQGLYRTCTQNQSRVGGVKRSVGPPFCDKE